jgi:acetoin utilization protein AcuC
MYWAIRETLQGCCGYSPDYPRIAGQRDSLGGVNATANSADRRVLVIADEPTGRYGFPNGHPFGTDRLAAFLGEYRTRGLAGRCISGSSRVASVEELLLFHTPQYLDMVRAKSVEGQGSLDAGDTPAFRGCFEAAAQVVGATLNAADALLAGEVRRAFVPIAGLHHAARGTAAGFCIFNDCGVLIEKLLRSGMSSVAYVDIDAHHGDGVFYAFESNPQLVFADLHEDGQYLYPGTGRTDETGLAAAAGTKLNIPLPPGADDAAFADCWPQVMAHLAGFEPQFIILQCGADSLGGDPITHLALTAASHALATRELAGLADRLGHGRLLALGGGGYNRANLAAAWSTVVQELLQS